MDINGIAFVKKWLWDKDFLELRVILFIIFSMWLPYFAQATAYFLRKIVAFLEIIYK